MSESFGDYNPPAAQYQPYLDEMAAWRNQVNCMQGEVSGLAELPGDEVSEGPEAYRFEYEEGASGEDATVVEVEPSEPVPEAQEQEPTERLFDPEEHNAPAVIEYLQGATESEVVRVLETEKSGKARKGILKLEDDLLAKAGEQEN